MGERQPFGDGSVLASNSQLMAVIRGQQAVTRYL